MKVIEFRIEASKKNNNQFVLIAKTEDQKEYVCSGDHYSPTYLIPIETAWDLQKPEKFPHGKKPKRH